MTVDTAAGLSYSTVQLVATATDNSGLAVNIVNNYTMGGAQLSGQFAIGQSVVLFTATDAFGNMATCHASVSVRGKDDGLFSLSFCGFVHALVWLYNLHAFPRCIVWTDTELPALTCPASVSVSTAAGLPTGRAIVAASASDNSGSVSVSNNYNATSGAEVAADFPIGQTAVTFVAVDAAGLNASCSVLVTVVGTCLARRHAAQRTGLASCFLADNEPPTIVCPASASVPTDAGQAYATLVLPAVTVSDNSGLPVTVQRNTPAGDRYSIGNTSVLFTATDAAGNQAVCITFVLVTGVHDFLVACVTQPERNLVVADTELPVLKCPVEVVTTPFPSLAFGELSVSVNASDNSGSVASVTNSLGLGSGDSLVTNVTIGVHTISFVATDAAGNTASCDVALVVYGA